MPVSDLLHLNLANTALIHDEVLLDISRVLEDGWPVGPSFLHSLGTLAEAVVIHDKVFFDPLREYTKESEGKATINALIRQSSFVQELLREGGLTLAPTGDEIDSRLESKGVDYRIGNFILDSAWSGASFASAGPEGEATRYRSLFDLVKYAPAILATKDLINRFFTDKSESGLLVGNPAILVASALGFNTGDLQTIESWNHRAAAYFELSTHLGTQLYPLYSALPHQLGALGSHNLEVRSIYERVEERVTGEDQTGVGDSVFSRVSIPPLAQIAIARCKGEPAALSHELLELRERHHKFRGYLTDFDRRWNEAATRADRRTLRREFDGAWETLLTQEDLPRSSMVSRIIGFIWDIVKRPTPTEVVAAGGDKVMTAWQERSIIRRVSGLHDFYQALAKSPLPERNRQLVTSLFPRIADDSVWEAAAKLAEATEAAFIQREPLEAVQQPMAAG